MTYLLILLMLFFPYLSLEWQKSGKLPVFLSPVILCYGIGILIANINVLPSDFHLAESVSEGSILFAIPFLLYSTDFKSWLNSSKSTILSFGLVVIAGLTASFSMAILFGNLISDIPKISGMLTGLYTGGIPNLNAIGKALEVDSETLIFMNAADIVTGGVYFLFLTSFAPILYGKILKPAQFRNESNSERTNLKRQGSKKDLVYSFLLTLIIVASAAGLTYVFTGELKSISLILLLLTTFSILASFWSKVRNWSHTFQWGEYAILIFCVALGLTADFSNIPAEGGILIIYTGAVLFTTVSIHLLFCKIFKIDRDTMLITSVAALYGPPFVGQIASVVKNKSLLLSGMTTGLVGYALGNYLGLMTAKILASIIAY